MALSSSSRWTSSTPADGGAQDAIGSFVSIWQPKEHIGSQLVNEPGTFVWNELATGDLAGLRAFYTRCSAGASMATRP